MITDLEQITDEIDQLLYVYTLDICHRDVLRNDKFSKKNIYNLGGVITSFFPVSVLDCASNVVIGFLI